MNERQVELSRKVGLAAIASPGTRLFILGSLPGDASLAASQYYAHPRNQFWRLIGQVIGDDLLSIGYEDRLAVLAGRGIGLWDVVASAVRTGSLDQSMRATKHNRLDDLLASYPSIRALAFNGRAAATIGRKQMGRQSGVEIIDLPSSSPANTRPFEEKLRAWSRLADFL